MSQYSITNRIYTLLFWFVGGTERNKVSLVVAGATVIRSMAPGLDRIGLSKSPNESLVIPASNAGVLPLLASATVIWPALSVEYGTVNLTLVTASHAR